MVSDEIPGPSPSRSFGVHSLLLLAAIVALIDLAWWGAGGINAPLFWDDGYSIAGARELTAYPLSPSSWGEPLTHHTPLAYLVHALVLASFPGQFVILAHVWQLTLLTGLLGFGYWCCVRRENRLTALTAAGLFAAWPFIPAVSREVLQDMPAAALAFFALGAAWSGRWWSALVLFAAASTMKLTAAGVLPALLWLVWRRAGSRRGAYLLLFATAAALPLIWSVVAVLSGRPTRLHGMVQGGSMVAWLLKLGIIHGTRHLLEIVLYDGHWLVSLAAVVALRSAWKQHSPRAVWDAVKAGRFDLEIGLVGAVLGVFLAVSFLTSPDSLQRYLAPLVFPLAWLVAVLVVRSGSAVAGSLCALGLLYGIVTSHDWVPSLRAYETALARAVPGLSHQSLDTRPAWQVAYVESHQAAARLIERQDVRWSVAAPWPASAELSDPILGYVKTPRSVRRSNAGENPDSADIVWIEASDAAAIPPAWPHRWTTGGRFGVTLVSRLPLQPEVVPVSTSK